MISADRLRQLGLDAHDTEQLRRCVNERLGQLDAPACWQEVIGSNLTKHHPFAVHQYICDVIFEQWKGPRPIWLPSQPLIDRSNIGELMRRLSLPDYSTLHHWSVDHREVFWDLTIQTLDIQFVQRPSRIVDLNGGVEAPNWLVGAGLNIVDSCFLADATNPAIVFDTDSGGIDHQTYGQLRALSNRVSNGLREAGFEPADAIAIDMPMTPESVAIYLGIIQIGGIVISIADSFAPPEIATRLKLGDAKAIFTMGQFQRDGKRLPLYEKIVAADPDGAVRAIVIQDENEKASDLRPMDQTWLRFLSDNVHFTPHVAMPHETINVLFSSGTTGEPKAIPWDHHAAIKCAADGYYHQDLHPGDVVAWPTNLGWMMGPWLIFATLINRGTIAIYSDLPTSRAFGEFVQDARINMLGVVPSMVRQWRESNCMEGLDWSKIRCYSSTGECSNANDMFYLMYLAGYRPIIEYCGGTEIGGGYITSTIVQPNIPSAFSTPALGIDLVILDDEGQTADSGELFLVPPSMGLSRHLLNGDHHEVYYAQVPCGPEGRPLRRHGDYFQRLRCGDSSNLEYYRALGRVDDTMNLGGVKVGSAEIERVLNRLEGLDETAAVAIAPPGGGPSQLVIFTVAGAGLPTTPDDLRQKMQATIKRDLNPLFRVHDVYLIDALPRTASNKVMRRELRTKYEAMR